MDNSNKKGPKGLDRRDLFKTGLVLAGGVLLPTACSLPANTAATQTNTDALG